PIPVLPPQSARFHHGELSGARRLPVHREATLVCHVFDHCVAEIQCPTSTDYVGGAPVSPVYAGTTGTGICNLGWTGSATRACDDNGQWADTATTSCTRITCAATTIDNAALPQTESLTAATGTCVDGYTGTPQATCSASGIW